MKDFSWYEGVDLKHPKKDSFTHINVYRDGEVLGKSIKKTEFDRSGFPKDALIEPVFDNNAYSVACSEYYKDKSNRKNEFKTDLFVEFGVEDNPKRELCYNIAYNHSQDGELTSVYDLFSDMVELIKDDV